MAKKNDWVQIHRVALEPADRFGVTSRGYEKRPA